jgi:hypothetical protein
LPGEYVLTPWKLLVVQNVTAYRGLAREDMRKAFEAIEAPVHGRWCVTPIRSGSNLNVTGYDASGTPQLASMTFTTTDRPDKEVKLPELARGIADVLGKPEPRGDGVREYLTQLFHNTLVYDPRSAARFIPNPADPLPGRRARVKFSVATADEMRKFKNRVGVGTYEPGETQPLDTQGTWDLLLDQIAIAVGVADRFALANNLAKFKEALTKFPLLQEYLKED